MSIYNYFYKIWYLSVEILIWIIMTSTNPIKPKTILKNIQENTILDFSMLTTFHGIQHKINLGTQI